jgi:hypothetical protein
MNTMRKEQIWLWVVNAAIAFSVCSFCAALAWFILSEPVQIPHPFVERADATYAIVRCVPHGGCVRFVLKTDADWWNTRPNGVIVP